MRDAPNSPAPPILSPHVLRELPLGAVKPRGWLLDQLRLQADGLTGHLEDLWADVGPNSAWLGGGGERWERGPYYLDGLVPLAHLLGDARLLERAGRWIEALLASQRPDGSFGPARNDDPWPRMIALKALSQHADATGDARVVPFMTRYLRFLHGALLARPLSSWGQARGAENVLSVLWLFRRTEEAWLLDLAHLLLRQTLDWARFFREELPDAPATAFHHLTHVVNVAMGLKTFAVQAHLGKEDQLAALRAALASLDQKHGLVNGMFSGDEWLAGRDPHHGVETCAVVELMFTLEESLRAFGTGDLADRLEAVAYNALPASCTADMTAHQYHQQPNQVLVSVATRDWTFSGDDANLFGLEPHFGCCTANLHQGWPKFVASLWMGTPDDGIAFVAYGPSEVNALLGGEQVQLRAETGYPFEEDVRVGVHTEAPARFPLYLRIPGWCQEARLEVNGERLAATPDARGFVRLERAWRAGDEVKLTLPMTVRPLPRDRGALGLALGPLVLAVTPGETWTRVTNDPPRIGGRFADWEVRPRKSWNFGLALDPRAPNGSCAVERLSVGRVPWGLEDVPLRVRVRGVRLKSWGLQCSSAAPPPHSPVPTTLPLDPVTLVPYGCARLRVAEYPVVQPTTSGWGSTWAPSEP